MKTLKIFLFLYTLLFRVVLGDSVCYELTMQTISNCVDVPGFIDIEGGNACSAFQGMDCSNMYLYTSEANAIDIINNCPASCEVCTKDKMTLQVIDLSTNSPPDLLTGSTFTGDVPDLNSDRIVTEVFCVSTPI